MDLLLTNQIAIVTGASRGIGRAIAETLSAEGMKLVLVARSQVELEALAASLPNESLVQAVDLRKPESANQVVAETVRHFGGIDLLVNNAGATKRGDFLMLTDDEWKDGFDLKFLAAMRLSRAAWPYLQAIQGKIDWQRRVHHRRHGQCCLDEPDQGPRRPRRPGRSAGERGQPGFHRHGAPADAHPKLCQRQKHHSRRGRTAAAA